MALKGIRGEEVEIGDVFKGFNYFGTSLIMFLVGVLAISAGLILLVIPGLLLIVLFQYAIPIAVSENTGAIDSLKKSYEIGRDNLEFSILLGIVLCVIGTLGSSVNAGALITSPIIIICFIIATLKLTEGTPGGAGLTPH